jgi:N-acetyltransferase
MRIEPVVLEGREVRLEPLSPGHFESLTEVGLDPELWRWIPTPVGSPDEMRAYIESALRDQAAGTALPFATVHRASGRAVGSTRFANIERTHRRVEIGWTWIARPWQRTAVNTEAKYLMLHHAFETWGCVRVELKTDSLNKRSRAAILRLGAREEGTLRNHMITASGRLRHSVYFSILDSEWPEIKRALEQKLNEPMTTETKVLDSIRHLVDASPDAQALMAATVELLRRERPHYNWVGIYLLASANELVLGPYVGKPTPHIRIPLNQGICGAAAATGETVIVDDVNADPRYLACSLETRSEIVVPIRRDGRVLGEIDIDSDTPAAFSDADRSLLEQVAALLAGKLP